MVNLTEIEKIYKGKTYNSIQDIKDCLIKYHIQQGKTFHSKSSDDYSIYLNCTHEQCPFKVGFRRKRMQAEFRTTQFIEHDCLGGELKVPSSWIKESTENMIKSSSNYKPMDLINYSKNVFGIQLGYHKARRLVKSLKNDSFLSSEKINFGMLRNYLSWIKNNNDNCTVDFDYNENIFNKCFVAYNSGFVFMEHSEKILFLDGCHTTGDYKGVLLTAVASDAMGQLFPIAYGLVTTEEEEAWVYFLKNLTGHLGLTYLGNELRIMSDRKAGLLNARRSVLPNAIHIYCTVHLERNIRYLYLYFYLHF